MMNGVFFLRFVTVILTLMGFGAMYLLGEYLEEGKGFYYMTAFGVFNSIMLIIKPLEE